MRTLWIVIGGVALWAMCLSTAKLVAGQDPAAMMTRATLIFLLIFTLPAVLALLVRWKIR